MKTIELVSGIKSSILGFGCAPILGSEGAKKSKRAIACALDSGINHFDIARSYGYGEAESFLGKALAGNRSNVVIASKFGIKANYKANFLKPLKPLIRVLKKKVAPINIANISENSTPQSLGNGISDKFLYRTNLDVTEMHKSLEQSLRALKTEYLDYFFIHEPLQRISNIDDISSAVTKLKQSGKIRAWGIAYMFEQAPLHKDYISLFDVLQFNNSSNFLEYEKVVNERGNKPNVIFSPLKSAYNPSLTVSEKLLKLSEDFSSSVILCSMFKESHIKQNCSLFEKNA